MSSSHEARDTHPEPQVAILALEEMCLFEFAIATEVFSVFRNDPGEPWYRTRICSPDDRPIRVHGCDLHPGAPVADALQSADLIVVPGLRNPEVRPGRSLCRLLRTAARRGARVMSICTGAYVLGHAGLLGGRRVTTHWRWHEHFQRTFPDCELDPGSMFVEDSGVLTSAGSSAGVDLCLHVVRSDFGSRVAGEVARQMVLPGDRGAMGGSAVPEDLEWSRLRKLLHWLQDHLDQEHDVESLSRRVHWPVRTFTRRFKLETGTTPQQWLSHARVQKARRLLEASEDGLERIARRVGFGSAQVLRRHFLRHVGQTPSEYRRAVTRRPVHGSIRGR